MLSLGYENYNMTGGSLADSDTNHSPELNVALATIGCIQRFKALHL